MMTSRSMGAPEKRSEHASLERWLIGSLSAEERSSIGLLSFNQWQFTVGALMETATVAHGMGSAVTIGFWCDRTPLPDPGWVAPRWVGRVLGSRTIDDRAKRSLMAVGLPKTTFVDPPIQHWRPAEVLQVPWPATRSAIRATHYRGSGMGRSILQVHPDFNTPIRDDLVWAQDYVQRAMESYAWVYDQTRTLVRQREIRTLVVFNGRFTHDRAAAAAAEAEGARVLYYDAGGLDTGFDLTTSTTHDWAHLQVRMLDLWDRWDDDDRDEIGRRWFLNRQAHSEPGLDVFVGLQQIGNVGELPDAEQLVVFFSSSGDEIRELELDWSEYLESQENALIELGRACRARPGARLVVRTHPHMRLKPADDLVQWTAAVEAAAPDLHVDPHSTVDSYALMRAADVVFTYGSTSGVEAAFQERPVVVMGPSAYDLLGCVRRIRTADEIADCLANPPRPDGHRSLPYGLMMERRGFNYKHVQVDPDGGMTLAGVRVTEPSEPVKKIGHWRRHRLLTRLTGGSSASEPE